MSRPDAPSPTDDKRRARSPAEMSNYKGSSSENEAGSSLLDSVIDDEDSCGDEGSLVACGSDEEYSHFVDETGRVADMSDERYINTVSPSPPTKAKTLKDPPQDLDFPRKNRNLSPPRADGLAFNMEEPWERSLLRQLEQSAATSKSPPKKQPANRFYLRHTDSRDMASMVDNEDAGSVGTGTTASSAVPTNPQWIHRSPYLEPPKPRIVHKHPSDYEDFSLREGFAITTRRGSDVSSMTNPYVTDTEDRDETNIVSDMGKKKKQREVYVSGIPDHLPKSTKRPTTYYLEMEPSNLEQEYTDDDVADKVAQAAGPDPACFCLGYNMFDYVLPPVNRGSPSGRRLSTRPLSRVEEEAIVTQDVNEDPDGYYYQHNMQTRRRVDI